MSMFNITWDTLSATMVEVIPELRDKYEEELHWWGEERPGPHIIYGDILTPFIISLLESGTGEEILKRIFNFLEDMAIHPDSRVQEVVAVTVCERLIDKKEWIEAARKYMGTTTIKIVEEMEKAWYDRS